MEIRHNDLSVLPRFAEMNLDWIAELHWVEPSDKAMLKHPESYISGRNSVFSIHEEDGVMGVCALKEDADGRFELTKMAVDEAARGRGIGRILMEAVETYAKDELKLTEIYLLSSTKNAAAIRLYKRCGWDVDFEGTHPKYGRCNIGMSKQL